MLATIQRFAQVLNQYANLLLVLLTAIYIVLTSRTLRALKQASLREREAHHLQEIKDDVIQPVVSWIRGTVFERFTGKTPELLTILGGYEGKPRQICSTVDDPFRARSHLITPSDPDVPDPLDTWISTESGRISMFLYNHSMQAHFPRELSEFDRLFKDVKQLTGAFISFANESVKEIADPEIPQPLFPGDENAMPEWTNPYLLAADCIHTILRGEKDPAFELATSELATSPGFYVLTTTKNQSVAKATHDKLKHWRELGLSRVRKRWEDSDLPDRVRNLLKDAHSVCQNMEQLRFTQSLGVDCELVSGKKSHR